MDIDLFSEIIKGLILDNDEVTLPGLGTFVSEEMPSVFSDKGYTINPPYRKLSFRRRESGDGRLLAEFYAEANGMDVETSEKILSEYIAGLRTILQNRKIVVFPGLGRLRATKENAFFFIADENLDIYPYGVGLGPVSLKTHEETADEVSEGIAALREVLDGVVEENAADGASTGSATEMGSAAETGAVTSSESVTSTGSVTETDSVTGEESVGGGASTSSATEGSADAAEVAAGTEVGLVTEDERRKKRSLPGKKKSGRGWRTAAIVVASVVGAAALALGIFILLSHVAPDFIDSLLYTPEELRIINY